MYISDELDRLGDEYDQSMEMAAQALDLAQRVQQNFMQSATQALEGLQKDRESMIADGLEQSQQVRQLLQRVKDLSIKLDNRNARIAELERLLALDQGWAEYEDKPRLRSLRPGAYVHVLNPPDDLPDFPDAPIMPDPPEVAKSAPSTRQKKQRRGKGKTKGPRKQGRGYRLSMDTALEMRQMFDSGGEKIADIARAYGVTYSVAHRICSGLTYKAASDE